MGDRIEREAVIEVIRSVPGGSALVEAIENIPGDRQGAPFEVNGMYFCPSCKHATAKVYKYCGYCGLKFDWSEPNAGENGVRDHGI